MTDKKTMITESEYIKALTIVKAYQKQIKKQVKSAIKSPLAEPAYFLDRNGVRHWIVE